MKKLFVIIGVLIHWLWKLLTTGSTLLVNFFFLLSLLFIISLFIQPEIEIPDRSALVLAPSGRIVEQTTVTSPFAKITNNLVGRGFPKETLLQDILDTIKAAEQDDRIQMIVLSLKHMDYAGLNQLQVIGRSLSNFKKSGKKVIAVDNHYSQGQYYLASFADEILLNPMGGVQLRGFGVFRLYMKELFAKLAINFHVFKVGSYKSAVEPFTRSDMSDQAREANKVWLTNLWDTFRRDISANRGLAAGSINTYINDMPSLLRRAGGSNSKMAIEANLVDSLKTGPELTDYLISLVGASEDGMNFKQIHFRDYLTTISPSFTEPETGKDRIGLIVARGNIVQGEKIPGQISSEGLSKRIRQAGNDDTIKALVLRIDSGGGSAFASEQIRQELLLLQKKGKPLVVSMGTLAASGAYWISANADQIFASPFTLTGSIGIFGIVPTFEESIAKIGITSDGTGTTKLAGAENPARPLSPELGETIQLSVEEGYHRFVTIVAEGRGIPYESVIDIAQGRVWDGTRARELGLVDKLGTLEEAIAAAGDLAGLTEFTPVYIRENNSSGQLLLRELERWSAVLLERFQVLQFTKVPLLRNLRDQFNFLTVSRDPADIYAHCLIPYSAIAF